MRVLCFLLGLLTLLASGGLLVARMVIGLQSFLQSGTSPAEILQAALVLGVISAAWMIAAVAFAPRDRGADYDRGGY